MKITLYTLSHKMRNGFHRCFVEPFIKKSFAECGHNVRVLRECDFAGIENISIGDNVSLGVGLKILTTRAKVSIGNDVMFGPNVTIITGDHRIDVPGCPMTSLSDKDKLPENDQNVVFEGDNWIGANAIILKGVRIGYGAVVAAGALVNHDIPPFSIWGGVPAKHIKNRFDTDTLKKIAGIQYGAK